MPSARARVLLVGVVAEVAAALHAALEHEAELVDVAAEEVLEHIGSPADGRHPTLVVIGRELAAPVGLVHAVRPNGVDLAVVVVSTPATAAKLATLPLLFSDDQARQVPAAQADRLPAVTRQLLESMARQGHYRAVRAAAQRQLVAGPAISHQVGEQLFGQFLTQAPIGAVLLDDAGGLAAWNHKAVQMLGLTEPDSLGRGLAALFPRPVQARLRRYLTHTSDTDEVFERIRADGVPQALRLAPQRVSDAQGTERILVLVDDVTDRVQAQRELAERTSQALLSADVGAAMTAPGTVDQHLHQCAHAIVDRLGAISVRIWTTRQRGDRFALTAGAGPGNDDPVPAPFEESLVGRIAAARRPVTEGASPDDAGTAPDDPAILAGYPLLFRDELMGVLALTTQRSLAANTLAALAGVADLIAVGIQQDRLLQRLSNTAATLQRSLLPPTLPDLPGVTLVARYLPAAEGIQAGGDWYDVLDLDPDHVALVVGDVVGQGAAAAAVMGQLRSALASSLLQGQRPAQALEHLNRFATRVDGATASTAAVLILDTGTGELRWASAGHPPPLIVDHRGEPRYLLEHGQGPSLGVSDELPFREGHTGIAPGSCVLLYTDGLIERRDADLDVGLDLLAGLAADLSGSQPEHFADRLLERVLLPRGVADDVALVITRLLPPPLRLTVPALATELPSVRRRVRTWSAQAWLPDDLTDDLVQCVDEATANCVEHAYPHGPGDIELELSTTPTGDITARISDSGRWLPPSTEKGYRGRGLDLIHKLAAHAEIDPTPVGTTVRLRLTPSPADPVH